MKKKILAILTVTTLALSMTACGTKTAEVPVETESVAVTEVAEVETEVTETEEVTEATEVTEETEATEVTEETEVAEAPAFTVTEMSAVKYAKSSVNVRKGPASDYEKLGGLSTNQKVTVTGQADTGWYRIEYNGGEAYVSDKYLVDQKVATSASNTNTSTNTSTNTTTDTNTATTTTDNTQQQTNTAPTDNSGSTWTGDTGSTSAPVDNTASAPADNSASSGTVIDGSGMSLEDLAALTGGSVGQTGGAENAGIEGNFGGIETTH